MIHRVGCSLHLTAAAGCRNCDQALRLSAQHKEQAKRERTEQESLLKRVEELERRVRNLERAESAEAANAALKQRLLDFARDPKRGNGILNEYELLDLFKQ